MKGKTKDSALIDIFDGKILSLWGDKDFITLSFPWATATIPASEIEDLIKDLKDAAKRLELDCWYFNQKKN